MVKTGCYVMPRWKVEAVGTYLPTHVLTRCSSRPNRQINKPTNPTTHAQKQLKTMQCMHKEICRSPLGKIFNHGRVQYCVCGSIVDAIENKSVTNFVSLSIYNNTKLNLPFSPFPILFGPHPNVREGPLTPTNFD